MLLCRFSVIKNMTLGMIEPVLQFQLEPVARRLRRLRLLHAFKWFWAGAALAGTAAVIIGRLLEIPPSFLIVAVLVLAGVAALLIHSRLTSWTPNYRQIARDIEARHPELHALLLTAVEQKPDGSGNLNFLQQRVVDEASEEVRKHRFIDTVSVDQLARAESASFAMLLLFLLSVAMTAVLMPDRARTTVVAADDRVSVTPGDVTIERGSGLVVLARFHGALPPDATLVVQPADGEVERVPLTKTLDDPVFGGSIVEVASDLIYSIEFAGQRTRDYKVMVFDYPRLERADAQITFPEYTGLPEKQVPDTRRVSAVEGSKLDLALQLNKPVVSATLVANDKSRIELAIDARAPVVRLTGFEMATAKNYELQLRDADGRANKMPALFTFDVLKNRAPELKLLAPRGDQRVSALQEIAFEAEAWDDFGLRGFGLSYTVAGEDAKSLTLAGPSTSTEKRLFKHIVRLEDLGVVPDQLLSWHLWAEDIGPNGQPRRTSGDMFFAEVRAFEEIFREDESGAGGGAGGQQGAGESLKLAELQKQIINATWKLQRRFGDEKPSEPFNKDRAEVEESQQKALAQAEMLKLKANDPRAQTQLQAVQEFMEKAVEHLKSAADRVDALVPALGSEQSAYQALLKLASREHLVMRGQRSQGGGGEAGGQANRQQLDQLELRQEERRYETQRQATRQQSPEQKEQLAVLNRLKELAQRQNDLNERIKELQAALQEAKTEAEKEELRRRLKRLREEERELLADVDQLRERMERPENQSRMSEAREQLEQTRSEVQRAAEALENNNPSQALASGARAQKELEQLREDFRKQNSSQFADEMRDMRTEARELAQKQNDISEQLQEQTANKRKTLGPSEEMKDLIDKLDAQSAGLTNLLEHIRSVSERSESSEPLLSKQLYETFRKSNQGNAQDSLNLTEELLRRSFVTEAGQFEQRARKELEELKRGVEQAAESVLGNEAEALRLARSELDDLAEQLQKEISAQSTNDQSSVAAEASARPDHEQQQPQSGESQSQQAEAQQGQSQQGQAQQSRSQGNPQQGQSGEGQSQAGGQQRGDSQSRQTSNQNRSGGSRNFFDGDPNERGGTSDGGNGYGGPLTGQEYTQWSERLGNVEEMLDDRDMRRELSRIRDRARNLRAEFKRHAKEPQWDLVQSQILRPLTEVRNRVAEDLRRHESSEALVPIDRDPVPAKFSDLVRRYYEKLGSE